MALHPPFGVFLALIRAERCPMQHVRAVGIARRRSVPARWANGCSRPLRLTRPITGAAQITYSTLESPKMPSHKSHAFTLIELLIVVAIIAILSAIAVPNFLEAQVRAKVSREKSEMRTIATALEMYIVDHGDYPPHGENVSIGGAPGPATYPAYQAGLGTSEFVPTVLTTPIAYMTVYLGDPFLSGEDTIFNQSYGYILSSLMRDILLFKNISPSVNAKAVAIPDFHGAWRLYAAGPDTDKSDAKRPAPYDPSNGTISDGDIIRSQKRSNDLRPDDE